MKTIEHALIAFFCSLGLLLLSCIVVALVWPATPKRPTLHVVAENTGVCLKCGSATQIIIKETLK